ncbi:MAG TPA: hypothetical protein VGQ56_16550 [Gemmatimonadaceae bacterium]|jgi:hypothetical protein|nr:hypothetical protein [Gemmatimonadaceae bacterium]
MINTTAEMIAGYLVAAILYGGYGVLLWVRARRVRRRLDAILTAASSRRSAAAPPLRRSR